MSFTIQAILILLRSYPGWRSRTRGPPRNGIRRLDAEIHGSESVTRGIVALPSIID